mgnify:FL=1
MAALGGSRHALINLSTQIDIPPIIKKSLSPATGYFGHKDEQSHHLNTFYVSFASVCALQMGAFCILQKIFQKLCSLFGKAKSRLYYPAKRGGTTAFRQKGGEHHDT